MLSYAIGAGTFQLWTYT